MSTSPENLLQCVHEVKELKKKVVWSLWVPLLPAVDSAFAGTTKR